MKRKTRWLDRYIWKKYADTIHKYKETVSIPAKIENPTIWVFWGQGETGMPQLVKACYRQLASYNDNVQLITKNNVREYINLPEDILNKVYTGQISWAHFSDIIRTALLATHGGLWLDSTVWVTGKIPEWIYAKPFYTACSKISPTTKAIYFWTSLEWNWSSWCMGTSYKGSTLMSFVSEMLQLIAINERYWPDYVIQDYLIYTACRLFPEAGKEMTAIQSCKSEKRNLMATMMNNKYDESKYRELLKDNYFFKLSFRVPWKEKTANGEQTFYGRILSNII